MVNRITLRRPSWRTTTVYLFWTKEFFPLNGIKGLPVLYSAGCLFERVTYLLVFISLVQQALCWFDAVATFSKLSCPHAYIHVAWWSWASTEVFPCGQRRNFAYSFQVADDAVQMDVHKTLYPSPTPQRKYPVLRVIKMRFVKIPSVFSTVTNLGCVVIRKRRLARDSRITFCKKNVFMAMHLCFLLFSFQLISWSSHNGWFDNCSNCT